MMRPSGWGRLGWVLDGLFPIVFLLGCSWLCFTAQVTGQLAIGGIPPEQVLVFGSNVVERTQKSGEV